MDIIIRDAAGNIVFKKENYQWPETWSYGAACAFAKHYSLPNESSVEESVDRITRCFSNYQDVKELIMSQKACFNSPVMFNFGTTDKPIGSACFILNVEDNMESIAKLFENFMKIYKNGAGAGVNVSTLRGSMERLSRSDGVASGPLSFMRIADRIAGVVKSGGRQRRAAKGVWIRCDHPDVEQFITCKVEEEKKARVLSENGYGTGILSEAYQTVAFQNMNISIQLTDEFMKAVENDAPWELREVTTGNVVKVIPARELLMKIAEAAWECGDPGVQFIDTINKSGPFYIDGYGPMDKEHEIHASNPCSEFMFIDNSACNLASINLTKFYDGNEFNFGQFKRACAIMIQAMDEVVDISGYPTPEIERNSKHFRPLGLGFTGLGSLLMMMGIPYGSPRAIKFVEKITREMSETAWLASEDMAQRKGTNLTERELEVLLANIEKQYSISVSTVRNAQVTLLAPTGTISIVMDTIDSTGIEPLVAQKAYKTTVTGQVIEIVPKAIEVAKEKFGGDIKVDPLYATSLGENAVSVHQHLDMMAAAQKYLSGAISKTVNLPHTATPGDVYNLYIKAWKLGLKAVAIYRDGSKVSAPLTVNNRKEAKRERLSKTRRSLTHRFEINGMDGHVTVGFYDDDRIGEIFVGMQKIGSTVQGLLNAWSIMTSNAIQYGVPIEDVIQKFKGSIFEPSGFTDNEEIQTCTSILDYVARFLESIIGKEVKEMPEVIVHEAAPSWITATEQTVQKSEGQICPECGNLMVLMGRCYVCTTCGLSGGCS